MSSGVVPRISALAVRIFAAYGRHYMRRRFHTIRILRRRQPRPSYSRPLVIFLNHASWWDPLVCLYLSRRWFSDRASYAPIDADSLERYRILKHIGLYGVEQRCARGAMTFLRTATAILNTPDTMVWLTPQGCFTDVRGRPLRLRSGIGALAANLPEIEFLPLAIEYVFWTEPQPEILISFGESIVSTREVGDGVEKWTELFAGALGDAQDDLASRSCRRDSSDWLVLERGAVGVGALYDAGRFLRARLTGARFAREHQGEKWI